MRRLLWPLCYGVLLTVFTAWLLLDTFVIAKVYTTVPKAPAGSGAALVQPDTAVITASSYSDNNIRITLTEARQHDTTIYVADVALASPALLKTALAQDIFGRNVTKKTAAWQSALAPSWPSMGITTAPGSEDM